MQVVCTGPWWHNRTYHKKGTALEVPAGTPVPMGFIVDGVEVPRRGMKESKKPVPDEKDSTIKSLEARVAELEAQAKRPVPRPVGRPPGEKREGE